MSTQKPLRQYQPIKFSDDEQTLTIGAERFAATDGKPGKCDGCEMKNGFGCDACRPADSPRCQPHQRKDGRHIVWAKATV